MHQCLTLVHEGRLALCDLEKHTATEKLRKRVKAHILLVADFADYDVLALHYPDFTPTWLDTWLPAWEQNKRRAEKGSKQVPVAAPTDRPGQQTTCLALDIFRRGRKCLALDKQSPYRPGPMLCLPPQWEYRAPTGFDQDVKVKAGMTALMASSTLLPVSQASQALSAAAAGIDDSGAGPGPMSQKATSSDPAGELVIMEGYLQCAVYNGDGMKFDRQAGAAQQKATHLVLDLGGKSNEPSPLQPDMLEALLVRFASVCAPQRVVIVFSTWPTVCAHATQLGLHDYDCHHFVHYNPAVQNTSCQPMTHAGTPIVVGVTGYTNEHEAWHLPSSNPMSMSSARQISVRPC